MTTISFPVKDFPVCLRGSPLTSLNFHPLDGPFLLYFLLWTLVLEVANSQLIKQQNSSIKWHMAVILTRPNKKLPHHWESINTGQVDVRSCEPQAVNRHRLIRHRRHHRLRLHPRLTPLNQMPTSWQPSRRSWHCLPRRGTRLAMVRRQGSGNI